MDAATRDRAVELLRRAAGMMETAEGEVILPGWDEDILEDDARRVRIAAEAIRAHGKGPDEYTRVQARDLGGLVRYLANMLE